MAGIYTQVVRAYKMGFLDCDAWLHMLAENFDCSCLSNFFFWVQLFENFMSMVLFFPFFIHVFFVPRNGLGLFTMDFPSEFLLMS